MATFGEQLEIEDAIYENTKKPGSYLKALQEAYHAGFDAGDAHANGYISEDETKFELWYVKKFLGGIGG